MSLNQLQNLICAADKLNKQQAFQIKIVLHKSSDHGVLFFATEEYSPFFIKRSELQVSYERTLIAQVTNH
jgi:hypothetical protein